jgi:hypothetical protein
MAHKFKVIVRKKRGGRIIAQKVFLAKTFSAADSNPKAKKFVQQHKRKGTVAVIKRVAKRHPLLKK